MILLAVSIVSYAIVFNKSLSTNCDETRTDLIDIAMNQPEEIVLEIAITSKSESFASEFSSTSTTSTSTTRTTTMTTMTSTTETAYNCWPCGTAYPSTEAGMSDSYSDSTTEDAFWGSDSSYDSTTEADDSDGWGFNWGN